MNKKDLKYGLIAQKINDQKIFDLYLKSLGSFTAISRLYDKSIWKYPNNEEVVYHLTDAENELIIENLKLLSKSIEELLPDRYKQYKDQITESFACNYWIYEFLTDPYWFTVEDDEHKKEEVFKKIIAHILFEYEHKNIANWKHGFLPLDAPWCSMPYPVTANLTREIESDFFKDFLKPKILSVDKKIIKEFRASQNDALKKSDHVSMTVKIGHQLKDYKTRLIYINAEDFSLYKLGKNQGRKSSSEDINFGKCFLHHELNRTILWDTPFLMNPKEFIQLEEGISNSFPEALKDISRISKEEADKVIGYINTTTADSENSKNNPYKTENKSYQNSEDKQNLNIISEYFKPEEIKKRSKEFYSTWHQGLKIDKPIFLVDHAEILNDNDLDEYYTLITEVLPTDNYKIISCSDKYKKEKIVDKEEKDTLNNLIKQYKDFYRVLLPVKFFNEEIAKECLKQSDIKIKNELFNSFFNAENLLVKCFGKDLYNIPPDYKQLLNKKLGSNLKIELSSNIKKYLFEEYKKLIDKSEKSDETYLDKIPNALKIELISLSFQLFDNKSSAKLFINAFVDALRNWNEKLLHTLIIQFNKKRESIEKELSINWEDLENGYLNWIIIVQNIDSLNKETTINTEKAFQLVKCISKFSFVNKKVRAELFRVCGHIERRMLKPTNYYQRAFQLSPDELNAKSLIKYNFSTNKFNEGLELYDKTLQKVNDASFVYELVEVLKGRNQEEDAVNFLQYLRK